MKIRRKTNCCLNCNHTLSEVYNFCPHCGQENNDNNVSFGTFVGDFFSNYFSFDTRIGRSIKPLFLRPGFLTNRFNEGKRMRYVHPLRLYLIVSVLFFFMASLLTQRSLEDASLDTIVEFDEDSADYQDTWSRVERILADETLTDQQALDSLQRTPEDSAVQVTGALDSSAVLKTLFHQVRKVVRKDVDVFVAYILQNLPIMMFLLIPLFALLLRLFYWRKRRNMFYVQHLVHALHVHGLAFSLYTLLLLLYLLFTPLLVWSDSLSLFTLLLVVLYWYVSLLYVYQQGWFKTLIKLSLISVTYFMLLTIFGLSEAIISFLLF